MVASPVLPQSSVPVEEYRSIIQPPSSVTMATRLQVVYLAPTPYALVKMMTKYTAHGKSLPQAETCHCASQGHNRGEWLMSVFDGFECFPKIAAILAKRSVSYTSSKVPRQDSRQMEAHNTVAPWHPGG
jgi:hypothetical protein